MVVASYGAAVDYNINKPSVSLPYLSLPLLSNQKTDYAVHIFHDVMRTGRYKCFLREDTRLPMMYLPDCIKATILCLEAPARAFTDEIRSVSE